MASDVEIRHLRELDEGLRLLNSWADACTST